MINWRETPFFRILLGLILGIVVGMHSTSLNTYTWILIALAVVILAGVYGIRFSYGWRWVSGLLILAFFGILGVIRSSSEVQRYASSIPWQNYAWVSGRISSEVVSSGERVKFTLYAEHALDSTQRTAAPLPEALVQVNVPMDTQNVHLEYGDRILIKGTLVQPIQPALNPYSFDYRAYMWGKGVGWQCYAFTPHSWNLVEVGHMSFWRVVYQWRKLLVNHLALALPTVNEFATGSALVLGYTGNMVQEVRLAYARTGAMHVLSVSGLHVGIVYVALGWFFVQLGKRRRIPPLVKYILILGGIWLFAVLTGASPSALRSAFMLSFVVVGEWIHRQNYTYNALFASAFVLLLFDPYLLYDVGFQLSYLATFGIVYGYKRVYTLFLFENKIIDYCWQVTAMGVAAQIATLPAGLYYFHQFPTYFWLSGLVVVPAASAVLIVGIIYLFVSFWGALSVLVGKLFFWTVWAMNAVIFGIEKLPYAVFDGIWLARLEVWLGYALLFMVSAWAYHQHRRAAVWATGCVAVLCAIHAAHTWQQTHQHQITVYHLPKQTLLDIFVGTQNHRIYLGKDTTKMLQTAQYHLWAKGIKHTTYHTPNGIHTIGQKQLLVLTPEVLQQLPDTTLAVDYLILAQNPRITIDGILRHFEAQHIIADRSNSYTRLRRWAHDATILHQNFYNIAEKGAFSTQID